LLYNPQEHAAKTQTMRVRERREIYLRYRQGLPRNRFDRATQAGSLWRQISSSAGQERAQLVQELRERIKALRKLYADYYGSDYVLGCIARNVFDDLLAKAR
jgi:hypothetical protein